MRTGAKSWRQGFTLIEVLIVISIVCILAGLILGAVGQVRQRARRVQAQSMIHEIDNAAKAFQLAYNRWPWEIEGRGMGERLNSSDILAELAPGNGALAPASYSPLVNRQRTEFLSLPPEWVRNGKVVDPWGGQIEFYWNSATGTAIILSIGPNQRNETIDSAAGAVKAERPDSDDISNL